MKKIITYLINGIIILFLACLVLFDFNKNSEKETKKMEKVKLAEVAHTIFYALNISLLKKDILKNME